MPEMGVVSLSLETRNPSGNRTSVGHSLFLNMAELQHRK